LTARLALVPLGSGLPASLSPRLATSDGRILPFDMQETRLEARVPADATLLLAWGVSKDGG